jgi:DNA-binding transcriptional regulator GbsR (MarR family)
MSSHAEMMLQTLLAKVATTRGFNAVEGLVLGTLLLNPQARTQRDIAKAIGRSQSTVSRALRRMTRRGVVEWSRRSGSREMVFSLVSESPKGLILSGIHVWLKTNSMLRAELELILKEQESKDNVRVEQIARNLIETIDYVSDLLKPAIVKLEIGYLK